MRTHATAQLIGGRSHQCDATATYAGAGSGTRAYALLDGIGSSDEVRDWTRTYARRLARAAARDGAEAGLRAVHALAAAEPDRDTWKAAHLPAAVAVVAVAEPGAPLSVAWCGDARAYLAPPDGPSLVRLTTDHNMRQVLLDMGAVPGPYARNTVTSYLGDIRETPAIESVTAPAAGRLLLASDGCYEPLEDHDLDLSVYLTDTTPYQAARALVRAAVTHAGTHADNATALVADL
ncbi:MULTISPECIES: protein phosphatase 2C domain-containing protein [Streptomyces]|uniref:Protein phosphatase 2C domain-containing protein n=1 Tax=Streptomyces solicathayae TaxID=3081768 RepID=A0ABZ0M3E5_9ACTN|nr:protein phosphatase 2C domain-containing protein [Streptomyces sp. HUAS YS2]WOX26302.1 protein phosphatase 2C domain-containing protein [Streptomyces sp. HUAS YS2]